MLQEICKAKFSDYLLQKPKKRCRRNFQMQIKELSASIFSEWAKYIFESAETTATKSTTGSVVNAFCNPQITLKLKNLISYLPLWTGIMRSHFQCNKIMATSSAVEATFADLKQRLFRDELPLRIDKFVIKHVSFVWFSSGQNFISDR